MRRQMVTGLMVCLATLPAACANLEGDGGGSDSGTAADMAEDATNSYADVVAPDGWRAAAAGECEGEWFEVSWVADGDTIHLTTGDKVRFLGIDTPETTSKDCCANKAKDFIFAEAPKGSKVCLSSDKKAGNKDNYGRLLRYVFVEREGAPVMLNARLLRLGLARVYDKFAKGLRYEKLLYDAQYAAKKDDVGGWSECGW